MPQWTTRGGELPLLYVAIEIERRPCADWLTV
jgi:hypothetical protein